MDPRTNVAFREAHAHTFDFCVGCECRCAEALARFALYNRGLGFLVSFLKLFS